MKDAKRSIEMKTALIGFVALIGIVAGAIALQPEKAEIAAVELAAQVEPEAEPTTAESAAGESEEGAEEVHYMYFEMTTSMGTIYLELDNELAPITTKNFLSYVESGHYNGTIFHRVMSNFMIQGGGFDEDMKQKEVNKGIKNEWKNGLSNMRGTIAMARLGRQPDSGTAQFFINVVDNKGLDMPRDGAGYAVFGKVVKGMETVDKIRAVAVGNNGGHQNVPVKPVVIEKMIRMSDEQIAEAELLESSDSDG
jgi:cyclophilin family peptidyl-prolyl cis-trans isomerase